MRYSKISDNKIKNGTRTGFIPIFINSYCTFNKIINNVIRDDQDTPTIAAAITYNNASCTDNAAIGNILHGSTNSNPFGYSATYRNIADKNVTEDIQGYPISTMTAIKTANIEADTSTSIVVAVPANARLKGVQLRVEAELAAGELWDATFYGGSTTSIATAQAVAKDTKVNFQVEDEITTGTTSIEITKNGGGAFTAQGTIRAVVYYDILTNLPDTP